MNRRNFLQGILAACVAPAIVRAGSIMRVKPILLPGEDFDEDWIIGPGQWQKLRYGLEGTFTREALSDADYSALSQRYAESLAESMRQARWFINPKSFRPELEIEPYG